MPCPARAHFRRHLAENGVKPGAGVSVLRDAIALVEDRVEVPIRVIRLSQFDRIPVCE